MQEHIELLTTLSAARLAGVSSETIRLWDRLGKLRSIRTTSGQRLFTAEDVKAAVATAKEKRRAG